jgi:hypothetical protein
MYPPAPPPPAPARPLRPIPPPPPPAIIKRFTLEGAGTTGVTELDAAEAADVKFAALVAVTVNVYAVPFVKPETVTGEDEPVPVIDPGEDVTV